MVRDGFPILQDARIQIQMQTCKPPIRQRIQTTNRVTCKDSQANLPSVKTYESAIGKERRLVQAEIIRIRVWGGTHLAPYRHRQKEQTWVEESTSKVVGGYEPIEF